MDIVRPDLKRKRRQRTLLFSLVGAALVAIATFLVLRLKPALPTVDGPLFTDTVRRGTLLRQVRGPGTLVPREDRIRLIPAQT